MSIDTFMYEHDYRSIVYLINQHFDYYRTTSDSVDPAEEVQGTSFF